MRYAAYAPLADQARTGRTGLLWVAAGSVSILLTIYGLTKLWLILLEALANATGRGDVLSGLISGSTPAAMLVLLSGYIWWFVAVGIALRIVHLRRFGILLGAGMTGQFLDVLRALLMLNLLLLALPPWGNVLGAVSNLDFGTWMLLLPLSIPGILIQAAAEEVVFRGYLQQQLAARFRSPLVWMSVPAVLFGLGHYNPGAGSNAWIIVLWAGLFSLLMSDLTARAGSLGPAIAVHFVNNAALMLFLAVPGTLDGLALYTLPAGFEDEAGISIIQPLHFVVMILSWLTARLALRR